MLSTGTPLADRTDTKVCPTCIPGNANYEPGEEGNLTSSALSNAITVDPNIKQPGSTQATAYLERQITEGVGARVGFVYYSVYDQFNTYQPLRPASAIVCGDFNLKPDDPLHARMLGHGFVDAWQALNPGVPHPHTFCVHDRSHSDVPYCCDFIFV